MKMAKASEQDMECANQVASFLESLLKGWMPNSLLADPDSCEIFDKEDPDDCQRALQLLLAIAESGSMQRVTLGMGVLLDPINKLVDPDADTLELHPDLALAQHAAALQAANDWQPVTASGQVNVGDYISCTVGGVHVCSKVAQVIQPGTDREEVVYNLKKNFYFITAMAIAGTSTHKRLHFRAGKPAVEAAQ